MASSASEDVNLDTFLELLADLNTNVDAVHSELHRLTIQLESSTPSIRLASDDAVALEMNLRTSESRLLHCLAQFPEMTRFLAEGGVPVQRPPDTPALFGARTRTVVSSCCSAYSLLAQLMTVRLRVVKTYGVALQKAGVSDDATLTEQLRQREQEYLSHAVELQRAMFLHGDAWGDAVEEKAVMEVSGASTAPSSEGPQSQQRGSSHGNSIPCATGAAANGSVCEAVSDSCMSTDNAQGDNTSSSTFAEVSPSSLKGGQTAWTDADLIRLSLARGMEAAHYNQMSIAANDFALIVKLLFKKCYHVEELVMTAVAKNTQERAGGTAEVGRGGGGGDGTQCVALTEPSASREQQQYHTHRASLRPAASSSALFDPTDMVMMMLPPGLDDEDYAEEAEYRKLQSADSTGDCVGGEGVTADPSVDGDEDDVERWLGELLSKVHPDALPLATLRTHCSIDLSRYSRTLSSASIATAGAGEPAQIPPLAFCRGSSAGEEVDAPTGVDHGDDEHADHHHPSGRAYLPMLKTTATSSTYLTSPQMSTQQDARTSSSDATSPTRQPLQRSGRSFSLTLLFCRLVWNVAFALWEGGFIEDAHWWLTSMAVAPLQKVIKRAEEVEMREAAANRWKYGSGHTQTSFSSYEVSWRYILHGGDDESIVVAAAMQPPPDSAASSSAAEHNAALPLSQISKRLICRITGLRDLCTILLHCESTDDVMYLIQSLDLVLTTQRGVEEKALSGHCVHARDSTALAARVHERGSDGTAMVLIAITVAVEFFLAKRARRFLREHYKHAAAATTSASAADVEVAENGAMREASDEMVRAFTAGYYSTLQALEGDGLPSPGDAVVVLAPRMPPVLTLNALSCILNYATLFRVSGIYRGVVATEQRYPNATKVGVSSLHGCPSGPQSQYHHRGSATTSSRADHRGSATGGGIFGFVKDVTAGLFTAVQPPPQLTAPLEQYIVSAAPAPPTTSSGQAQAEQQQPPPPLSLSSSEVSQSPSQAAETAAALMKLAAASAPHGKALMLPSQQYKGGVPLLEEEVVVTPSSSCSGLLPACGCADCAATDGPSVGAPTLLQAAGTAPQRSDPSTHELSVRLLTILHRHRDYHNLERVHQPALDFVSEELGKAMHLLQSALRSRYGEQWWAEWRAIKETHLRHFYAEALAEVRTADMLRRKPITATDAQLESAAAFVPPPTAPRAEKLPSPWWGRPLNIPNAAALKEKRQKQRQKQPSPQSLPVQYAGSPVMSTVEWDVPPTFTPEVVIDFSAFTTTSLETQLATKALVEAMTQHSMRDEEQDSAAAGISLLSARCRQILHDELPLVQQYSHWRVVYSTRLHGVSLRTMLSGCARAAEELAHNGRRQTQRSGGGMDSVNGAAATAAVSAAVARPMLLVMEVAPSTTLSFSEDSPGVREAAAVDSNAGATREVGGELAADTPRPHNRLLIGAYLSHLLGAETRRYYGNSDTFIFQMLLPAAATPDGDGAHHHHKQQQHRRPSPPAPQLRTFRSTGANELFINCRPSSIVVGGGGGSSLFIDSSLANGATGPCPTFASPPLTEWCSAAAAEAEDGGSASFTIVGLEVTVIDS